MVGDANGKVRFSTRASKWLDEQHLVKHGAQTDWKQQFKLRHNWSRGTCGVDEILVAEQPHIPPMIVQMHEGIIMTADEKAGLRAWAAKGGRGCLARTPLSSSSPPTAMAIQGTSDTGAMRVLVAFEDGSFEVHLLSEQNKMSCLHRHESNMDGVITAVALSWPHVLTMSASQRIALYRFEERPASNSAQPHDITELHSVQSQSMWSPLSVSLRHTSQDMTISIAFALPTYLSGWTVGVQETRLRTDGTMVQSRTASAIDQHYRPLAFTAPPMLSHFRATMPGLSSHGTGEFQQIHSKPTSLSYTHPYLLVSHPDNTLTLYLVFSTIDALSISAGSRLWGHTSSISGAHVGDRGKAVSISRRGDELRIWELEGGFATNSARKRLTNGDLSVRIKPGYQSAPVMQNGIDLTNPSLTANIADEQAQDELTISRGWIGFDSENVAVLKEESNGKQALVVYDFT